MNEKQPNELIEESIRLEQNVAALYQVFSETIPADADFWRQLQIEELSHAKLIRGGKDSFLKRGKFPYDLIADSIEELKQANANVLSLINQCKANPPTRQEACEAAIQIENESGESHYTCFMEKDAESPVETVFQQLNREDKDHDRRIRERLESLPPNG